MVVCLPPYRAPDLLRGFMLGQLGPGLVWATGYLLVVGVASILLANRRLGRPLVN